MKVVVTFKVKRHPDAQSAAQRATRQSQTFGPTPDHMRIPANPGPRTVSGLLLGYPHLHTIRPPLQRFEQPAAFATV